MEINKIDGNDAAEKEQHGDEEMERILDVLGGCAVHGIGVPAVSDESLPRHDRVTTE